MNSPGPIDRQILRQAAQLLVRLNSGHASAADHAACERWREQSDAHRRAWALAQQLQRQFDTVPEGMGSGLREDTGGANVSRRRRRAIRTLSWLAVALPVGWLTSRLPWQTWNANYRTSTGELRDVVLTDGSRITLGGASAIDVAFDASQRRIHLLGGEIMVQPADGARNTRVTLPGLVVQTTHGLVEALGTQLSVRQQQGFTRVAAFRGDERVSPVSGAAHTLRQGECCTFTRDGVAAVQALDGREAMWTRGLLYANGMRIAELVAELSRYRRGVLRYADDVADLRVSGIYQLTDTDATLALLQRSYPIRVRSITPYWTMIEAAGGHADDPGHASLSRSPNRLT
jgi:transmembrane sensor